MTDLIVSFSADITAADESRRTITGQIVPFGAWGQTSMGPVQFAKGAFSDVPKVKLLLEHDVKRPIGRMTSAMPTPEGINATFKIARTTAGTDALVEAADGLRDGLSVGARILDFEDTDEGMVVTAAELSEVSLVHSPAFTEAVVSQVAASASDPEPAPASPENTTMENETPEVDHVEVVLASDAPVEAAAPTRQYIQMGADREVETLTAGRFMKAKLLADAGDRDAERLVTAALADNTTTTAAGLVPTRFLRDVIGVLDTSRPFVNSLSREALPDTGMDFKIPRRTAKPTVAEQTYEGEEVSSTAFTLDYLTVDVKTFGGGERISRQLIERSDPAFLDRLILEMASAYAQKVDDWAYDQVIAATTSGNDSSGTTVAAALGQAIADSWNVMRFSPTNLLVAPTTSGQFGFDDLLKAVDQDGRPLYSGATQLVNQPGNIVVPNATGSIMGLNLIVDGNIGSSADPLVYPAGAATFYENAAAPTQVSVQDVSTLEVEVAVYGYAALAVKYGTAFRTPVVTSA